MNSSLFEKINELKMQRKKENRNSSLSLLNVDEWRLIDDNDNDSRIVNAIFCLFKKNIDFERHHGILEFFLLTNSLMLYSDHDDVQNDIMMFYRSLFDKVIPRVV